MRATPISFRILHRAWYGLWRRAPGAQGFNWARSSLPPAYWSAVGVLGVVGRAKAEGQVMVALCLGNQDENPTELADCRWSVRQQLVADAILYRTIRGIQFCMPPGDCHSWKCVDTNVRKRRNDGAWQRLYGILRMRLHFWGPPSRRSVIVALHLHLLDFGGPE